MPQLLHDIGFYGPMVAVGLSVLGGLVAGVLMLRRPIRERTDRGSAVRIGLVYGVVVGGVGAYFIGSLAAAWGGQLVFAVALAAVIVGVPLALVPLSASLTGYAMLARRGSGSAVAGAFVGPLVLGAIVAGGIGLIQVSKDMRVAEILDAEYQEVTDRSEALRLSVASVTAAVDDDGTIARVHLTAIVEADQAFELASIPGKWTEPHFSLTPDAGKHVEARQEIDSPPGSPSTWAAGSRTAYTLTFDAAAGGAPERGHPGTWLLRLSFTSRDGQTYLAERIIEVRP